MSARAAYQRQLVMTRRTLGKCRHCHRRSGRFTRCLKHRLYWQAWKCKQKARIDGTERCEARLS